jgi:RNA polymerase sigma-70 factor (ECF subfamily)
MPESEQHKQDENRLLEAAQNGDIEAYGQLYQRYAERVFRFLYARMEDRQDAEDLTEDTFFKVWQALPGYRRQGTPFGGYLFRVARNVLIDHYRRNKRRPRLLALSENQLHAAEGNPAKHLAQDQQRQELRAALGRLSEDYRMVLSLRFFGELSSEEIGAAMERSPGAVRVLQHRALAALRKILSKP